MLCFRCHHGWWKFAADASFQHNPVGGIFRRVQAVNFKVRCVQIWDACLSQVCLKSICYAGRWRWTRFPHTWRNHLARSTHPCRTSHQAGLLLLNTNNFKVVRILTHIVMFWLTVDRATQEHNWNTGHWSTKQPNWSGPLSRTMHPWKYIQSINYLHAWIAWCMENHVGKYFFIHGFLGRG